MDLVKTEIAYLEGQLDHQLQLFKATIKYAKTSEDAAKNIIYEAENLKTLLTKLEVLRKVNVRQE